MYPSVSSYGQQPYGGGYQAPQPYLMNNGPWNSFGLPNQLPYAGQGADDYYNQPPQYGVTYENIDLYQPSYAPPSYGDYDAGYGDNNYSAPGYGGYGSDYNDYNSQYPDPYYANVYPGYNQPKPPAYSPQYCEPYRPHPGYNARPCCPPCKPDYGDNDYGQKPYRSGGRKNNLNKILIAMILLAISRRNNRGSHPTGY